MRGESGSVDVGEGDARGERTIGIERRKEEEEEKEDKRCSQSRREPGCKGAVSMDREEGRGRGEGDGGKTKKTRRHFFADPILEDFMEIDLVAIVRTFSCC